MSSGKADSASLEGDPGNETNEFRRVSDRISTGLELAGDVEENSAHSISIATTETTAVEAADC